MRVLITGGAGFIGWHVAAKLRAAGAEIFLLDNFNQFYDPEVKRRNVRDLQKGGSAALYEVDILDQDRLARVFTESRPEALIHLAAWAGVRPSLAQPRLYAEVNVTGTVNLLELARKHEVRSFIFGSSSSVYGGNTEVPFSEEDPANQPISPYAATKRAGELLCQVYSHNYGLHVSCLRFFTVYGPRQRPEMAIHKFARLMWQETEVPVYGTGESRRDYTYVDDIVSGVLASLRVNPRYDIFNLGESRTISLLELIAELEAALGKKARIRFCPPQPGDMEITYADISRAQRVLGYQPSTSIKEGLRKFARWFLESQV